jgi:RimJ/RimL family protein N-acetyltransferase
MNNTPKYLFQSARLGFRNWKQEDVEALHAINTDDKVMEFLPKVTSITQTQQFIDRMNLLYNEKGFCYFAVDALANHELIGFIGLSTQNYAAHFTPCVDIGWRLKSSVWNQGYASEGAVRCLQYAQEILQLKKIYAIAPISNNKSQHIMSKIGLQKSANFEHPLLLQEPSLKDCVVYETI